MTFKAALSRLLRNATRFGDALFKFRLQKILKFFKNLRHAEFTDRLFKFKIRAIFLIGGMVKAWVTLLNLDRREALNSLAAGLFMWF